MKIGDYVRTKDGLIRKIVEIDKLIYIDKDYISDEPEYHNFLTEEDVIKTSPNIIDLIEVGDYVNGLPVERIEGTLDDKNDIRVWFGVATYGKTALNQINHRYVVKDDFEDDYSLRFRCIKPDDIKSIATKEQFSQMEYKVGE